MSTRLKINLTLFILVCMCVIFALSVGAAEIYKDVNGNELFRYDLESNIIKNEQGVGFAKVDSENDALIWYITETKTENSDNIYTVASVKTKDATTIPNDTHLLNKEVVLCCLEDSLVHMGIYVLVCNKFLQYLSLLL